MTIGDTHEPCSSNRPAHRFVAIAAWQTLRERTPVAVTLEGTDLVLIRHDDRVAVFQGRCPHRGALLAEGCIEGDNLVCGEHGWDFRLVDGAAVVDGEPPIRQFTARVDLDADAVLVDANDVDTWARTDPRPFRPEDYVDLG